MQNMAFGFVNILSIQPNALINIMLLQRNGQLIHTPTLIQILCCYQLNVRPRAMT